MEEEMLVCTVGSVCCALPLRSVIETMRPLPVEPIAGAPAGVLGMAIIRGVATVVVDAAALLATEGAAPRRFVTLRAGDRTVALAVEAVVGVRALAANELPPLLRETEVGLVDRIAARDGELMLVLRAARLVEGVA